MKVKVSDKNKRAIGIANQIGKIIFDRINNIAINNKGHYDMTAFDLYNLAFACELYIKVILSESKIEFKNTHNLEKLIELLDDNSRADIIIIYDSTPVGKLIRPIFYDEINEASNSFIKYRYIHEDPDFYYSDHKNTTTFLLFLSVALQKYITHKYY